MRDLNYQLKQLCQRNRDGRSVWSGNLPDEEDDRILVIRLA